jgi:hypothetical protein
MHGVRCNSDRLHAASVKAIGSRATWMRSALQGLGLTCAAVPSSSVDAARVIADLPWGTEVARAMPGSELVRTAGRPLLAVRPFISGCWWARFDWVAARCSSAAAAGAACLGFSPGHPTGYRSAIQQVYGCCGSPLHRRRPAATAALHLQRCGELPQRGRRTTARRGCGSVATRGPRLGAHTAAACGLGGPEAPRQGC